jgi:hypothetical protein
VLEFDLLLELVGMMMSMLVMMHRKLAVEMSRLVTHLLAALTKRPTTKLTGERLGSCNEEMESTSIIPDCLYAFQELRGC